MFLGFDCFFLFHIPCTYLSEGKDSDSTLDMHVSWEHWSQADQRYFSKQNRMMHMFSIWQQTFSSIFSPKCQRDMLCSFLTLALILNKAFL